MKTRTSERLKEIMKKRNLKQVDILSLAQPYLNEYGVRLEKNDLSQYVSGKVEPGQKKVFILAKALNVSEAWLMGFDVPMQAQTPVIDIFQYDNIRPMPEIRKVPRLGVIACGEPILANEEHGEFDTVPIEIKCDFTLVCKGNSMINARIFDGDVVAIKAQPTVENGEIAAVIIEDEATLKRVYQIGDTLILQAENPTFPDLEYHGEELNHIKILGKAVYFVSQVR